MKLEATSFNYLISVASFELLLFSCKYPLRSKRNGQAKEDSRVTVSRVTVSRVTVSRVTVSRVTVRNNRGVDSERGVTVMLLSSLSFVVVLLTPKC